MRLKGKGGLGVIMMSFGVLFVFPFPCFSSSLVQISISLWRDNVYENDRRGCQNLGRPTRGVGRGDGAAYRRIWGSSQSISILGRQAALVILDFRCPRGQRVSLHVLLRKTRTIDIVVFLTKTIEVAVYGEVGQSASVGGWCCSRVGLRNAPSEASLPGCPVGSFGDARDGSCLSYL